MRIWKYTDGYERCKTVEHGGIIAVEDEVEQGIMDVEGITRSNR